MSTHAKRRKHPADRRLSMEVVVEMVSSSAATRNQGTFIDALSATPQQSQPQPSPSPESWRAIILSMLLQLRTRRSWAAGMIVAGTADMFLNVVNLVQMTSDDLNYGLVVGPTTRELWICLCFFTVIGTLFYVPETINTVSALYSADGDTLVPFHYELTVTLLLEHIPLSAIDYLIIRTRRQVTTSVQSMCGVVRLVFIIVRLMWYAHIEGKKLRKNDKYQLHHLLIMLCYILFSVAVAFPVNNLRKGSPTQIHRSDLEPVSIFMLKRDRAPERQFELDITDILQEQGWTERNYTLVHSALAIHKAFNESAEGRPVVAYYQCFNSGREKPRECLRNGARFLRFSFVYQPVKSVSPWGEISYNFAELCLNRSFLNPDDSSDDAKLSSSQFYPLCYEPKRPLQDGWRLFYFKSERKTVNGTLRVVVSQPFEQVQTTTMPKYNPRIPICVSGMHAFCEDGKGTRNTG